MIRCRELAVDEDREPAFQDAAARDYPRRFRIPVCRRSVRDVSLKKRSPKSVTVAGRTRHGERRSVALSWPDLLPPTDPEASHGSHRLAAVAATRCAAAAR